MSNVDSNNINLDEFLDNHTYPVYPPFNSEHCVCCQEPLAPSSRPTSGEGPDHRVVRVRACLHTFHHYCLFTWIMIHSTNTNRNRCPICRCLLFRLNVLTPFQAASVWSEEDNNGNVNAEKTFTSDTLGGLNHGRYMDLMTWTDEAFERERDHPDGSPNYLAIFAEVTTRYSLEHFRIWVSEDSRGESNEYLYFEIAERLHDRIIEANLPLSVETRALFLFHRALAQDYYEEHVQL